MKRTFMLVVLSVLVFLLNCNNSQDNSKDASDVLSPGNDSGYGDRE